jgi:hypothetical protein
VEKYSRQSELTNYCQVLELLAIRGLRHPDSPPADFSDGRRDSDSGQLLKHFKLLAFKPRRTANGRHPETESAEYSDDDGR